MIAQGREAQATLVRPALLPLYKGAAALFGALVLLQAFLAGRGWFKDHDLIDVHGMVANVVFLVFLVAGLAAVHNVRVFQLKR